LWANGDLKKIAKCKVKPFRIHDSVLQEIDKDTEIDDTIEDDMEHDEEDPVETDLEDGSIMGPRTHSMEKEERRRDANGAYWITSEKSKCFDMVHSIFVIELPIKHHKLPAVVEAKEVEVNNLKLFNTYEEVDDVGQPTVGGNEEREARWTENRLQRMNSGKRFPRNRKTPI
jgi:hypothetical protein